MFGDKDGRSKVLLLSLAGELGSRPCQKRCGEDVEKGDDPAGEASLENNLPCEFHVRVNDEDEVSSITHLCLRKTRRISTNGHGTELGQRTVCYSGQLGWRGAIAALLNAQRWNLNVAESARVNNSERHVRTSDAMVTRRQWLCYCLMELRP